MPTLDWLNRPDAFRSAARVPYRLLDQISVHGDAANHAASNTTSMGNLLIQGDNLEALKALLPFYRGQVKCIFIDPPYNTKSAFEHYDDNLEHSQWLSMMLPRLQLLRELLREDGSIWVTIDDNEGHYLKVMMDEVFGRGNFVANVVWEKSDSPKMDSQLFSTRHDHLLAFAKHVDKFELKRIKDAVQEHYNRTDEKGRRYYTKPLRAMGSGEDTREARPSLYFALTAPDGSKIFPVKPDGVDGRWRWGQEKITLETDRIEWVKAKAGWAPYYRIYADTSDGRPAETIWAHTEVGSNRTSKAEVKALLADDAVFTTPKPEALLQRILHIASNENDLVLDSFLGSGTTAAVAHKMRRRWIGIEMGEHAATHCLPRLQKVIDGEQGGISKAVNWGVSHEGKPFEGGGFRFMRLGEPVFDESGRIHSAVRFNTLAAFIWQQETRSAWDASHARAGTPHLGIHYEIDSTLRNIYAGEVPKTLEKTAAQATSSRASVGAADDDLFAPQHESASAPASVSAPAYAENLSANLLAQPKPRFALYLLYNGILKDKRPQSGNVLTAAVLDALLQLHAACCQAAGENAQNIPITVYGEACRLGAERLKQANVTFRHIPYDVRAR